MTPTGLELLIPPPYERCPRCGEEGLGVAHVSGRRLTRRCVRCGRPSFGEMPLVEELPEIHKSSLYLDQFATSNFAVLIDPGSSESRRQRAERWRPVYERVSALVGVEKLVCPSSGFHTQESLPRLENETFSSSLERVQTRLSAGIAFSDALSIELGQLYRAAQTSNERTALDEPRLILDAPFRRDPHEWSPRQHVGVTRASMYGSVAGDVASSLRGQGEALQTVFAEWHQLSPEAVRKHFDHELESYGRSTLDMCANVISRLGSDPLPYGSAAIARLNTVRLALNDDAAAAEAFLLGEAVKVVPKVRVAAAMYAVLARQAANGRPDVERSFAVDTEVVSTVLPYVDAILVDRRCAEILRQPPARDEVARWKTTVLSAGRHDEAIAWLDARAAEVTDEHLALVRRVYGPHPVEFFRQVFSRPDDAEAVHPT